MSLYKIRISWFT